MSWFCGVCVVLLFCCFLVLVFFETGGILKVSKCIAHMTLFKKKKNRAEYSLSMDTFLKPRGPH